MKTPFTNPFQKPDPLQRDIPYTETNFQIGFISSIIQVTECGTSSSVKSSTFSLINSDIINNIWLYSYKFAGYSFISL